MTMRYLVSSLVAGGFAIALIGCTESEESSATAGTNGAVDDSIELAVEERQALFEDIGDAFKVIRAELESDAASVDVIGEQAALINERAQGIAGLWPVGSSVDDGVDTEALASIWEKPEEFAAATEKLIAASADMVALAEAGDLAEVAGGVRPLGMACKGCHDNFRLDTD